MSGLHGSHLIGGEASRQGKEEFFAFDPTTGARLPTGFVDATEQETGQAMKLAREAERPLRVLDSGQRADFLERIADEIEALGDVLVETTSRETGLPSQRLLMERGRTTNQLRLFSAIVREGSWVDARIDHAQPDRTPVPKPDLRSIKRALGPVVVFGASNFPLAFSVAGGDTASAIAAGCPVVVKAHQAHPATSELTATAVSKAVAACGLPQGAFSLLQGRRVEVGLGLVAHPFTKAVGFTGSLQGGRALFDAAADRPEPIPVYAEMGSTNPVFLLPRKVADGPERLAEALHASVTLGVGQFCTNPGVVVTMDDDATQKLLAKLEELTTQAPTAAMLHAGIRASYDERCRQLAGVAGVSSVASTQAEAGPCAGRPQVFHVEAATFQQEGTLREEVFGPSTIVVRCKSKDELLEVARDLSGQLTLTIHGTARDLEEFGELPQLIEERAGRLVFGGFPTGVEVCPSMHHGGPYPATTDVRSTSVGTAAIARFARPVCFQNWPSELLPPELQDSNPRGILRIVDGVYQR